MPDAITATEVCSQHVELLPARTVLSLFSLDSTGTNGASGSNSVGTPKVNILNIPVGLPNFGR